ncbi:ABC transporter substrate-binding protein [Haloferax mediterranei ATCC 33500]|uniref:ABC transporter substrate-binding protein n=1 Tax=Haloferax mediterranei (strain ATCC 33500 / DSM 1411 / JCM 8866 / NBRC 14739 / NCIMB 2177 / R-4) TaxID=523841 RepID=I3R628_HALMT|nr:dipeptide ABC transporter ATP-binding protein [Haloferax mediterranei ATCC 33500]AHZ23077.1 peptide ABC transporter substrate-binding protein [Haloferax mediterranei ATCC 33500]EMA00010.1 dipeptide ABC transporter ATP-binding protein [Haloferax mediterranei ATCC 33500]QCQ76554.1 ABC transporter substrate-binding protein [Haloferax mediterranei ATCC 33500]
MTFRVGSPWTPDALDPIINGWLWRRISVIEPLLTVDYDTSITAGLATSWELADDGETWRFDLREGVEFHDGTPLTADAVVFSLKRAFDSNALAALPIESVSALDEQTVSITTDGPFAPLPAHLTRGRTSIIASSSVNSDGDVTKPVGTGPFQFASWEPGMSITATANGDYHGPSPKIDRLVYEGVADSQTRRLKLQNDELDMARILPNHTVEQIQQTENLKAYTYEIPRSRYLVFDTTSEPFDDRRVRQAVMHAIDGQALVESILEGLGSAATGPFPPEMTSWANDDLEPYEYAPEKAGELLTEAGWRMVDGTRQRDGVPLDVDIWTYESRPLLSPLAQVLQAKLGEVGFDVSILTMEPATIRERANSEAFGMVLWSNSVLWYPDPDRLTDFVHSSEATMFSGYENPEVDALLEQGRRTPKYEERKQIYDDVQAILQRDVPIGWLTYYTNVVGTRADVTGYRPHPTEASYHLETVNK